MSASRRLRMRDRPDCFAGARFVIALGPFVLEQAIGRGGMAIVWRAFHREQGQQVAVKVLTTEAARNPLFFSTFRSEFTTQ